jgi:hypothetical protein
MRIYLAGIGEKWRTQGIDNKVLDYVRQNEGNTPNEIATALVLTVEQVLWALDQGDYAFLPETTDEKLQKEMTIGKGKPF